MIKTRFAPSPTGFLHVGGARTALFNYLFARRHGGKFVLRIEDTDQVRSTAESASGILQDMLWLGLTWDEGPVVGAPKNAFFQSMRLDLYNQYIAQLIAAGRAYEAYETPAQLAAMREQAQREKRPFRYRREMPGRAAAGAGPAVLRFQMPHEDITVNDLVLGNVVVKADEHDDIIIRKSDGFPTYHFAVVVDDHAMEITHVLRAQEHLMNTPRHLALYAALGWSPPAFGHLPLVFNMDGTKMSKREKARVARGLVQNAQKAGAASMAAVAAQCGVAEAEMAAFMAKKNDDAGIAVRIATALHATLPEIDVQDFRRSGYLPEALLNFIALVGWSPGEDREILSFQQLVELFSVEGVGKTNGRFDRKKLLWMNGQYIRSAGIDRLLAALDAFDAVTDYPLKTADTDARRALLGMYQERMGTLAEMAENSRFFFAEPEMDPKAVQKFLLARGGLEQLRAIRAILGNVQDWTRAGLASAVDEILAIGEKRGEAAQPLRVALSGNAVTPPVLETLALLGRQRALARIDHALAAPAAG